MAVPVTISDLSTTAASNSPAGTDTVTSTTGPDDYIRALSAIIKTVSNDSASGANVVAAAAVTPADADVMPVMVGGVLKKLTWANLKATLKTYFDGIYQAAGSYMGFVTPSTSGNVLTSNGSAWISGAPPAGIVAASTAETQAGALTTKAVTPAGLLGAIAFANHYNSGNQTITPSGSLVLAHGLGREPINVKCWLKCLTAEYGYSLGDKTQCSSSNSAVSRNLVLVANSTNILIRFGASMAALNFTTGIGVDLTSANWALVIDAWA